MRVTRGEATRRRRRQHRRWGDAAAVALGADDLLPLTVYVVIRSRATRFPPSSHTSRAPAGWQQHGSLGYALPRCSAPAASLGTDVGVREAHRTHRGAVTRWQSDVSCNETMESGDTKRHRNG